MAPMAQWRNMLSAAISYGIKTVRPAGRVDRRLVRRAAIIVRLDRPMTAGPDHRRLLTREAPAAIRARRPACRLGPLLADREKEDPVARTVEDRAAIADRLPDRRRVGPESPSTGPTAMPRRCANDPEMYRLLKADADLDRKSRELAVAYRQAPDDQRDKIKELLEQVVNEHFEVRQQRRSLELKRLEDELKSLRDRMDRRAKARKEIVEKRVSTLLGIEDDLHF